MKNPGGGAAGKVDVVDNGVIPLSSEPRLVKSKPMSRNPLLYTGPKYFVITITYFFNCLYLNDSIINAYIFK